MNAMSGRDLKNLLYEQVARIARAAASPKRLELIEVLVQGEKSVEQLAADAEISVKLTSAHLKELRQARLVEARREGRRMFYRLVDRHVADFWVMLRGLAEERLLELQAATRELAEGPGELAPMAGPELLEQARRGEVIVLDVRPGMEYANAHLPYARSIPVHELRDRLGELPADRPVVAYCRGPYCLMASEAVEVLGQYGFHATRLEDGVAEWRYQGLPLETVDHNDTERTT
ncbi:MULTISPECIES: metalloregulator ArsR/SmtB family transcription factor [unclassified Thioalkalivibrio]|uniref:ArsR/SmtB family transcription factor n=1 Tax=unclassified Thioalkalivibrio TaxID=2621013 RepID=UPI0004760F1A|nr:MULTISPECIES: metalloregulator ArsR/SmtB family transcription factor [unclassified Thioalkalivibrio]